MKNSIKRAQSQACLSFAERENFRPKVRQLKKTLLTLVALLAVTTGAWAQTEITTIPNGDFETWTYDGEDMPNNWNSNATSDGDMNGIMGGKQLKRSTDVRPGSSGQYSCSIWSTSTFGVTNIGILTSGRIHFGAASPTSNANYIYSDRDGSNTKNNVTNPCAMPFTGKPTAVKVWVKYVQGGTGYGQYATAKFSAIIHGDADYVAYNLTEDDNDDNKALVVASAEQEIAYNNGEWEQLTIPFNYTDNNVDPAYILIYAYTNAYPGKGKANDYLYIDDIELEYAPASPSGPEVAWDKAKKTGQFTMPGGNVTLEPEYYPQAALTTQPTAINDVPATTDGAIVSAGTVANIGETTTAQGTVMYYVSQTALDDAALLALAADKWTANVPTAADLAQGQAYVYYYVRGNDSDNDDENFSDGDILAANALTVTIAAAPTYAVTFADGVNPEPPAEPEWTASPAADVKKGQTVTVTYTGSKKVIGVKAEKKAATPSLNITSPVVGQVIGSDGKNYAAANVPSGVDKVAMIAYVSGSNGLAIALADEGQINWSTAIETCAAHTPAFTNGTWKLPSQDEWKQMFSANGGDEGNYNGLNTAITTAGGTAFQDGTVSYWSSSEYNSDQASQTQFYSGYANWFNDWKVNKLWVRAVLAF